MLYLPPYWFHKVITEEPGVGLNVWSTSDGRFLEKELEKIELTFVSQKWNEKKKKNSSAFLLLFPCWLKIFCRNLA